MKRDMELIRKILLAIEDCPTGFIPSPPEIEGYTDDQIGYHAYLMKQAGLIDGADGGRLRTDSPMVRITNLTWKGHEFLDAARDDTRWRKALGIIKEKGGSVAMDVLKDLLIGLAKGEIGIP